jgi:tRNA A-37 threonylcarbamoyl transferase component Bud32
MLTSGQLLADRYRLSRRIAVGGMGEVWEAADTRLDRPVAVKVLKPELCGDAEFLHRFRTEARTTASLNHPGIAGVHDYGETAAIPDGPQDTAYLVMELVEGEPLAAIISRLGRLTAEATLDVLEQAGHALQAAHERGYVHRDVKPGNIMVGPTGVVKLTDFGIAKAADAAPVTRSGMVMGTAHYIAPEQALGGEAEPASDVYSLAVVGYECLIGHRPFLSDNAVTVAMKHIRELPPPLPPDVPPGVRALIEATLIKDPRQRYRSGGEFAAAVAAVRAGMPLPTPSGFTMVGQQQMGQQQLGQQPGPPGMQQMSTGQQMPVGMQMPMQTPPGMHNTGMHSMQPSLGGTMPPSAPVQPPPGARQDHRPRQAHPLWLLVGVLVVLLIAVGVWAITQAVRHSSAGTPGPVQGRQTTTQQVADAPGGAPNGVVRLGPAGTVGTVTLDGRTYVGGQADEVVGRLRELGLRTTLRTTTEGTPDPARCVVGAVTPTGAVVIGTLVTVTCTPDGNTR